MQKIKHMIAGMMLLMTTAYTWACDNSSFDLVSMTDLGGGQYEFVVTFCAGGGPGGADQGTATWGVELVGGATWASYPATMTSPQTGAVYAADNTFMYGPQYLIYDLFSYPGTGWGADWWTTTWGGWGPAGAYCVTFTLVTNGMPTQLILMGAEGAGVGVAPYGCNGLPEMEINFGLAVDAGAMVSICSGDVATVTATATGGTAPYTYSWSNGATTASINVSPTANTDYTVTVTDANGNTDSDIANVIVNPRPTVNAGTDKTITIGYGASCTTLNGSATGGSSPYTYSWSSGATIAAPSVCPTATTTYTLTVTDYYGCSSTDQAVVTVKDVRCGPSLNKVYVCKNGTTKCINQSQVPSHLSSGWVLGACWMKLDDMTAMGENPIDIFPNPASQSAEVVFIMPEEGSARIELYSLNGQRIELPGAEVFGMEGQEMIYEIQVQDIPAGMYQVMVFTADGQIMTERLAVIR